MPKVSHPILKKRVSKKSPLTAEPPVKDLKKVASDQDPEDIDLTAFVESDSEPSDEPATALATAIDPALFEDDDDEEEEEEEILKEHDGSTEMKVDDATKSKMHNKIKAANKKSMDRIKRGTIYLGRIPHGFYEDQMRAYFTQFGTVTRLRLSRNKKTGRSKHYAFIEFENEEVAKIVADTMNNYLMFGHLLKCSVVPPEKIHEKLWIGANRKFRVVPWVSIHREKHNRVKTEDELKDRADRLLFKEKQRREKLKSLGIDYDFPGFAATVGTKVNESKGSEEEKKTQEAPVPENVVVEAAADEIETLKASKEMPENVASGEPAKKKQKTNSKLSSKNQK